MHLIKGSLENCDYRLAIVVSRFNEEIVQKLLQGALEELKRLMVDDEKITVVWVPGAFEIPLAVKCLTLTDRFDAIICLGAVIRGETYHFEVVANESARGIAELSRTSLIPIMLGILTTDTEEQALERACPKKGNKGAEVTAGAIEMINLIKQIQR